jgi:hypothetical protein
VADEPGGRQLGVALDELEADAELGSDRPQQRRLPRAGRPLQQDVAPGGQGGDDDLELAAAADDALGQAVEQRGLAQNVITPRMFLPSRMSW